MTQPKAKTGWHPEDIKAAVRKSGSTLAAIAIENGFDVSNMSHALTRRTPNAQRAIANHLGKSLHELWPQFYDANGNRVYRCGNYSKSEPRGRRQNEKAA